LKESGHEIRFRFAATIAKDLCLKFISENGFSLAEADYRPDVMFVADCDGYDRPPTGVVVDIGHGLGSKHKYFYKDSPYHSDYVIVASKWIADRLQPTNPQTKFLPLGMPKLDRAFRTAEVPRTILIAPTHNYHYSCLVGLVDYLEQLRDYRVILKPHEFVYTSASIFCQMWRHQLKHLPPNVEVRRDPNIAAILGEASIVISDVSSAYLEALGLGKHVIIFESPFMAWEKEKKGDMAHEYCFQSLTHVINNGRDLLDAVQKVEAADQSYPRTRCTQLVDVQGDSIPRIIKWLENL